MIMTNIIFHAKASRLMNKSPSWPLHGPQSHNIGAWAVYKSNTQNVLTPKNNSIERPLTSVQRIVQKSHFRWMALRHKSWKPLRNGLIKFKEIDPKQTQNVSFYFKTKKTRKKYFFISWSRSYFRFRTILTCFSRIGHYVAPSWQLQLDLIARYMAVLNSRWKKTKTKTEIWTKT